jgi:hypothetical protein
MRRSGIALLVAFGMAGCGGMSDEERFSLTTPGTDDLVVREIEGSAKPPPKKVTPGEVKVIRGWANALRAGRVKQAADFFAVPSTVFDGTNPTRPLPNLNAVRQFNRGLPCGAQLVDAVRGRGWFVIATFRLTERTGPGAQPCDGEGNLALTAFLIEKRHIVQWLRQPDPISPPDDNQTS